MGGIFCLEVLFLFIHACEHAIEHLKELLVGHTLRLLKSLLLRFLLKFAAFFFSLLLATVCLFVFLDLVELGESLVDGFAAMRFLDRLLFRRFGFLVLFLSLLLFSQLE